MYTRVHLPKSIRGTTGAASAALLVAVAIRVALPTTAEASACGTAYWRGFTVNLSASAGPAGVSAPVRIPSGQLTHCVRGSGYYVEWDGANFASAKPICDTSMKFTYGSGAQSFNGTVRWGCSALGRWKYALRRKVPEGNACAELWAKNWRVRIARQCHHVHR